MKLIQLFCSIIISFSGFGQIHENFKAQRTEENVYLSWTITEGNTCNGIQVQRSVDSINFETIHDIQGVCGSTSKKVLYDFTDTMPEIGSKNYYRLILGTTGVSEIISIQLDDIDSDELKIFPNPSVNNISIQYGTIYARLVIFDIKGNKLYEKELNNSQMLKISKDDIQSGVYLFTFYTNKGKLITKKVVLN